MEEKNENSEPFEREWKLNDVEWKKNCESLNDIKEELFWAEA